MWKIVKINFLVTFTLLLIIEIILLSLNFIYDGVPMYRHFNLSEDQVISYKQKQFKKNKLEILDEFYIKSFQGYNKESYLKSYLEKNKVKMENIYWMKGSDINFPIFFDKNSCRENKNENYIFSDTVLIGDSSLFGYSIASPYDIAGKLRELNPDKKFLNLGIPGTGPRGQVNHLEDVTQDTNFENLIWFFVEANDYEVHSPDVECGYSHKEPEKLFREYIDNDSYIVTLKIFLAEHLRGLASFSKLFISYDDKFNLDKKKYEETTKKLKIYLDKKNVKNRYLYYLPYYNRHSYKNDFFIHPNIKKLNILRENVKKIVTKHGFKFIDGDDAVRNIKNKKKLYHYEYQTHYNAKGYTLTAEHINSFLNAK